MPRRIEDWRDELEAVDAEIVRLLNRRAQLAIELLRLLRSDGLTLGSVIHDLDRLLILLYHTDGTESPLLRKPEITKLFKQISRDCRQAAEREVELLEGKDNSRSKKAAD